MKVFNLQCDQLHLFEGWFASEDDFVNQSVQGLVTCPLCDSATITKMLSAPRLNLGGARIDKSDALQIDSFSDAQLNLQTAWMAESRRIMARTDDVGAEFAEEARKIHYGEIPQRGIRGKASHAETASLIEEGIAVMPLLFSEPVKRQLQ